MAGGTAPYDLPYLRFFTFSSTSHFLRNVVKSQGTALCQYCNGNFPLEDAVTVENLPSQPWSAGVIGLLDERNTCYKSNLQARRQELCGKTQWRTQLCHCKGICQCEECDNQSIKWVSSVPTGYATNQDMVDPYQISIKSINRCNCAIMTLCWLFLIIFPTSRKTGLIYNVESEKHLCKWDPLHAEGPYRTKSIMRRLEEPEGKLNWVDGMIGYWSIGCLIDWWIFRLTGWLFNWLIDYSIFWMNKNCSSGILCSLIRLETSPVSITSLPLQIIWSSNANDFRSGFARWFLFR